MMRLFLFCCLLAGAAPAQTAAQLEALERYSKQPSAHVTWSKEIGRVDTNEAHAVVTALVVEDATQTPRQMRGIRIDLTDGDVKDQVYASEDLLDRLLQGLDEIAKSPRMSSPGQRICSGSRVFWQQPGHAFAASSCIFPDWSGLSVSTGSDATFRFSSISPDPFRDAIGRAKEELKRVGEPTEPRR